MARGATGARAAELWTYVEAVDSATGRSDPSWIGNTEFIALDETHAS